MGREGPYRGGGRPLAAPPRRIPVLLWLVLRTGTTAALFGWGLLAVGSGFAWVFLPAADLTGVRFQLGEVRVAQGVVERTWQSSASGQDLPVEAAQFRFQDADGRTRYGVSYGRRLASGTTVEIEHLAHDPAVARIRGMRRRPYSEAIAWVLIFPAVGLGLAMLGWRSARRPTELLARGRLGLGKLVAKEATDARIDDHTVFVLTFELDADGRAPVRVQVKTHRPAHLEDEEREPLLHHPEDPSMATLLDALPGLPRVADDGTIAYRWHRGSVRAVLLPLATVVVNVVGAVATLG